MNVVLHKFPYRYFPYEERFLVLEARTIGKVLEISDEKVKLRVDWPRSISAVKDRLADLTYCASFEMEDCPLRPTNQFKFEASTNGSGISVRRQSTRYSTHGVHEYKGKFNPQIARHLMNRSGVTPEGIVLDPFCGSGTVLIEAAHYGCHAIGIDSNPLCELVTNARLTLLRASASEIDEFESQLRAIISGVAETGPDSQMETRAQHLGLSAASYDYLVSWFPRRVLGKLLEFRLQSRKRLDPEWATVSDTLVSSVVRDVSYQDPADLRIRRRKKLIFAAPVEQLLESVLKMAIGRASSTIPLLPRLVSTFTRAYCADSRNSSSLVQAMIKEVGRRSVDVVITSPPYATALPYIDTSRLSLVLLGLSEPQGLRRLEHQQIGNREIPPALRDRIEQQLDLYVGELPAELSGLVLRLLRLVKRSDVGFRKRNVPALLAQYFVCIKQVLLETMDLLKPTGVAYWIVGKNRTHIDSHWIEIDTPRWIAEVGASLGFSVRTETMNTYQRFGLHHRNSIKDESLLVFGKR